MANDDHMALLKRGVAAWNAWRRENPSLRPNLRGAVLHEDDLREVGLHEADLCGADLRGVKLFDADLRGAILIDAKLGEANLFGACHHCRRSAWEFFTASSST